MTTFMACALFLLGATPEIQGNTTVDQYKLVQLSVNYIDNETAILWDVYPEELVDIREYADGSLVFTGPPGSYKIKLRLINGRNVTTVRTTVKINQGGPKPPDNPDTPDTPVNPVNPVNPVLPDGRFKLAQKSKDWSAQVNSINRFSEAQALAGSLESVIAAANAGTVASVDEMMKLARDTNRQALGSAATAWQQWFASLKNEFDALYDAKLLANMEDYKVAFKEISTGLRSVK